MSGCRCGAVKKKHKTWLTSEVPFVSESSDFNEGCYLHTTHLLHLIIRYLYVVSIDLPLSEESPSVQTLQCLGPEEPCLTFKRSTSLNPGTMSLRGTQRGSSQPCLRTQPPVPNWFHTDYYLLDTKFISYLGRMFLVTYTGTWLFLCLLLKWLLYRCSCFSVMCL